MTMKKLTTKGVVTCVSVVACLVITSVLLLGFVFPKQITIVDSGSEINVLTLGTTVDEVLNEKNISLGDGDYVLPPFGTALKDDSTITIYRQKTITVIDEGETSSFTTTAVTVKEALKDASITVNPLDMMSDKGDTLLTDGMTIEINRANLVKVTVDGKTHERYTARRDVKEFLDSVCIYLGQFDEVTPSLDTPISDGLCINVSRVIVREETYEENVARTVVKKQSSDYNIGETIVEQEGSDGVAKNTYKVIRRDSHLVSATLINSETIKAPVDKIITVGTNAPTIASRGDVKYKKVIQCLATAYEPGVQSNGKWAGITATGRPAGPGIVAVDPKVIPLNSKLYIESTDDGKSWSYGYAIAGDTGGGIKGNRIDLCYSTVAECYQFGKRQCNVYILE